MHVRCPPRTSPPPPTRPAQEELQDGEEIARCPSCSLLLRVIYDPSDIPEAEEEEEEGTTAVAGVAGVDSPTPSAWPAPSAPALVTM